jgi:hypothetical protein
VGCKRIERKYTHAGLVQAAFTSVGPEKHSQAKVRESWYGKPDSLLAQTLQKQKEKTGKKKLVFKLPKN